jgi:hypothetical protein
MDRTSRPLRYRPNAPGPLPVPAPIAQGVTGVTFWSQAAGAPPSKRDAPPSRGSPESSSPREIGEAGQQLTDPSTDHSPPVCGIPARHKLRTMNSAEAAANVGWISGPRLTSLQFVQSFAADRAKANMSPPVTGPHVTGADTQSQSSLTLGARLHGCHRPFARRALSVGLIARRAWATAGRCAESNASHACLNIASACLMASTMR